MTYDGRIFLAGKRVDGARTSPVRAPWDNRVIADVHRADERLVDRALAEGAAATAAMRALAAHERRTMLRAIADGIRQRATLFTDTIVQEAGKPRQYASAEVQRAIATFDLAADSCWRLGDEALDLGAVPNGAGRTGLVRRFPVGLVAAISPFNFPLNLVAHKLAPAFATGCPVVLKPASQTPLTALLLADVCHTAGVPAGGLSVIVADRSAADLLVLDERVRLLSFTGSAAVGWDMKARAKKKRVVLELGGDAAAVVLDDADLDLAVSRIAVGAYAYAGQVCIKVQRVIVTEARAAELQARLLDAIARTVVVGDPNDAATVVGPMIDDFNATRARSWIDEAVRGGARVLCGADPAHAVGRVVAPTLLADVPDTCAVARDEAFAPIAHVLVATDVDDAIARVNSSRFGLQVGVFTRDVKHLLRCHERCEVGAVIHDDAPIFRVDHMPYGGVKDSGFGREGIPASFGDYTEPRLLALRA
jgi:glyceraldehyde-3-phosphate dehydrogenase (NADP+)